MLLVVLSSGAVLASLFSASPLLLFVFWGVSWVFVDVVLHYAALQHVQPIHAHSHPGHVAEECPPIRTMCRACCGG